MWGGITFGYKTNPLRTKPTPNGAFSERVPWEKSRRRAHPSRGWSNSAYTPKGCRYSAEGNLIVINGVWIFKKNVLGKPTCYFVSISNCKHPLAASFSWNKKQSGLREKKKRKSLKTVHKTKFWFGQILSGIFLSLCFRDFCPRSRPSSFAFCFQFFGCGGSSAWQRWLGRCGGAGTSLHLGSSTVRPSTSRFCVSSPKHAGSNT